MPHPGPQPEWRRVGVISDTHGKLRDSALAALQGVELIIHAGDVGDESILPRLRKIAPVHAVRGNIDKGELAASLPATEWVEFAGKSIYILHDLGDLDLDPAAANVSVVITGHSHKPNVLLRGSVLYLNPGSAGPRRFKLPITVAWLDFGEGKVEAKIVEIEE